MFEVGCDGSAGPLEAAAQLLVEADRLHARAVALVGEVERDPAAEVVGLGVEGCLREDANRTAPEARLLVAAAERLVWLPTVGRLLNEGAVSWSTVRAVVACTRSLTTEQLSWVDRAVADQEEGFRRWGADGQLAAVAELADRARPELHRDRGQRCFERSFLSLQPGFDGSLQLYGELDAESGAAVLERLDAPGPGESGISGDDEDPVGPPMSKGARQAERLHQACVHRCGPTDLTGNAEAHDEDNAGRRPPEGFGRARPSMLVLTPIDRLADDVCSSSAVLAQLLLRTARGPVSLSQAALQRLRCDATLRQVLTGSSEARDGTHDLTDGYDVLGVTAPTETIPTRVRVALHARDAGCRFPGCRAPAQWTDGHHVIWRSQDGPTTLDNLVSLCRRHHRAVHEGGWRLAFDARSGVVTVRRGDRTFTSRAHADRTLRAPPPPKRRRGRRAWPDRVDPPAARTPAVTEVDDTTCPF